MIRTGLAGLLSHWRRAPFQLVTLLVGLAVATALWSGVQAINAEARASYDQAASGLSGLGERMLESADGTPIAQSTWLDLRRAGHRVSPLIDGRLGPLRIIGIDAFTLPGDGAPIDAAGADPAFFSGEGRLIVAPDTARPEGAPPMIEADGVPDGIAYADVGIAQRLLGREGRIDRLVVTGRPDFGAPPLTEVAPGLVDVAPATDVAQLTGSFHLNLTAFGLLSFAVGLFIVRGAVGLAFEQRRGMFRTLRALGLPRGVLMSLVATELLILAVVAGILGVALGWAIAAALMPDVAATLRGLYGADVSGGLTLRASWWISGMAIAVLGTGAAAASALWQTWRLPLLAPARPRAWAVAGRRALVSQTAAGLGLWALGLLVLWLGSGVVAGFALLGALLLGAALLLPPILDTAISAAGILARGPRREWAVADTRQQLPGLSLALMALLLALASNIGVGTMVSSFRLTFVGWLDQRLAAELYVETADTLMADRLTTFLEGRATVLPIARTDATLAGGPGTIIGVTEDATYTDNWPLIASGPDVWPRVFAGEAVLINEQIARRADLWPGSTIDLPGWPDAPVAGVYSDYGNPESQAMAGVGRFLELYPNDPPLSFGIRTDTPDALARAISARPDLSGATIMDQAETKALSLSVFDRTFAVTSALNVLTLGVAGIAILTSLLTLSSMRLPALAPPWALGLTRRRLAAMELTRAVVFAAFTFAVAVPVGLALAWTLLALVNVEAFGWRLPVHVFPSDWARLLIMALVAAALAALWPAIKLARTPPSELLKVFANDR